MQLHKTCCFAFFVYLFLWASQMAVAQSVSRRVPSAEEFKIRQAAIEKELATATTDSAKARLNLQLSTIVSRKDKNQALALVSEALSYAKKTGDAEIIARAYFGNGNLLFRINRFDEALENLKTGISYAHQLDNPDLLSNFYQITGQVYQRRGMYEKALENYQHSLTLRLQVPSTMPFQLSTLNLQIGNILSRTGKSREAIEYLEKSVAICEQEEDWEKAGGIWHNIAVEWLKLGENALADQAFAKAGELTERSKKKATSRPLTRSNSN